MISQKMPASNSSPSLGRKHWQSWWLLPIIYLVLGVVILLARGRDGHWSSGIVWFAIMAGIASAYAVGGRFQIIRQARGDYEDEREGYLGSRAMAATGTIMVVVLTACIVWELARGDDPRPFSDLMAIAGATYIASLAWGRYRS